MDLSLPSRWPNEPRFNAMDMLPTALYTLVNLTEDELRQVQQACESGCVETGNEPNTSIRTAPQARFPGQPLRAVFDHHVELRSRDSPLEFDPKHFVVVVDENWPRTGVLLITLDDEEEEEGEGEDCRVDSFFIKAEDSGLSVVNIQVGNMDWAELKENFKIQAGSEDDGGDDDNDDNNAGGNSGHGQGEDAVSSSHSEPGSDGDDLGGPPTPEQGTAIGDYIPIYIHSQLQPDAVLQQLEPLAHKKTPDEYACRIQGSLTPSPSASSSSAATDDLVAQAAALHPLRCAKNKWLYQTMFLVVDTADPAENGMLMVRLNWKGLAGMAAPRLTRDALTEEGAALAGALGPNSTLRLPYNCQYGLQRLYLTIAEGDAPWPSEAARGRPKFCVYQYDTPGEGWGLGADLLYAGAPYKQEYGQEQLAYDQELVVREDFNGSAKSFEEAVLRFPMVCRENRLVENFDTRYFICIDRLDIADAGVLLGRRDWDGNVWGRTNRELMGLDVAGVRSTRVPVKDALNILTKGRAGDTDGLGPQVLELFRGAD